MGSKQYKLMANLPPPTQEGTRLGNKYVRWSIIGTVATVLSFGLMFAIMS